MPEADSPATSEPATNAAAPGPVVVLIEDEAQIRRFLRAALVGSGFRLFEAATGESGVVETATRQPEIVILDLGLPDIDGLEVIRRIREWSGIPIIVRNAGTDSL